MVLFKSFLYNLQFRKIAKCTKTIKLIYNNVVPLSTERLNLNALTVLCKINFNDDTLFYNIIFKDKLSITPTSCSVWSGFGFIEKGDHSTL